MGFSELQTEALEAKLKARFVRTRTERGKTLSYIEGWRVISEANRIFGFDGWSRETMASDCVWQGSCDRLKACSYRARVRITVHAGDTTIIREGSGAGHGSAETLGEAHESALKEAETDATKRALVTFGNPFGLSLYDRDRKGVTRGRGAAKDLTALSAAAYLLVYTPLKSRSYMATLAGAVPGAFPALIGWTAATGRVELGGIVLFGIAFLWQLPHVLALAWLLKEDYARVGFFLTPPTDPSGVRIGRHMVYHSISLLLLSGFPTLLGLAGVIYLTGAAVLGFTMLALAGAAAADMNRLRARRVFLFSLVYQPLLMGLLLLDTTRL